MTIISRRDAYLSIRYEYSDSVGYAKYGPMYGHVFNWKTGPNCSSDHCGRSASEPQTLANSGILLVFLIVSIVKD
jgi:hypothetical protein